jgi:L-galactono-1,4-lactone dehydrogenase
MMSMALLDRVLWVDPASGLARVEAGCRVQQVADALKPHGLALANYASIREQQIGGFTQVSAHGTGARVPPVDTQVVAMKVVTPGKVRIFFARVGRHATIPSLSTTRIFTHQVP